MRFSTAAWGLRRDGSEFIGEMSWGIVETSAGQLLLAVGRDISEQRAAEARLRAVAAMGERALAGADPADLAGEAIERLRKLLPVTAAEVRLADGSSLASYGPDPEAGLRFAIGTGDELLVAPARALAAGGAELRSRGRAHARHRARAAARRGAHAPRGGARSADRPREPHACCATASSTRSRASERERERHRGAVRRPRQLQAGQRRPRPRRGRRRAGGARPAPADRRPPRATRSRGSAATNSSPCASTSTRSRRSRSAGVCSRRSGCRSPPERSSTSCRPASGSRSATPTLTPSSPTPTRPPTAPRRPAADASSFTGRR